jgi:hypothetical protein
LAEDGTRKQLAETAKKIEERVNVHFQAAATTCIGFTSCMKAGIFRRAPGKATRAQLAR